MMQKYLETKPARHYNNEKSNIDNLIQLNVVVVICPDVQFYSYTVQWYACAYKPLLGNGGRIKRVILGLNIVYIDP
jgi:hypothetical protein